MSDLKKQKKNVIKLEDKTIENILSERTTTKIMKSKNSLRDL